MTGKQAMDIVYVWDELCKILDTNNKVEYAGVVGIQEKGTSGKHALEMYYDDFHYCDDFNLAQNKL